MMKISNRRQFLKSLSIAGLFFPLTGHANHLKNSKNNSKIRGVENFVADGYLSDLKIELTKEWPQNRTINLVFHGHSVPSGYFKTPYVNTLGAYPHLLLIKLKELYPNAVVNTITTSIGGENSEQGAERMNDVLNHRPDVVFIDYALNDRSAGLETARKAWSRLIKKLLKKDIKVILLTPSPDLNEDILSSAGELSKHRDQVVALAKEFGTGLVDAYQAFKELAHKGENLSGYMAQFNHPNQMGHQVIADTIFNYFR